jgi:hypothetical protein
VLPDDPPSLHLRSRLVGLANQRRLPLFGPYGEVFESGAPLSYGESLEVTARKSATCRKDRARGERCRTADRAADTLRTVRELTGSEAARHQRFPIGAVVRADKIIE